MAKKKPKLFEPKAEPTLICGHGVDTTLFCITCTAHNALRKITGGYKFNPQFEALWGLLCEAWESGHNSKGDRCHTCDRLATGILQLDARPAMIIDLRVCNDCKSKIANDSDDPITIGLWIPKG